MNFSIITPQSSCWHEVVQLYTSSFPYEERREIENWQTLANTISDFHILALLNNDDLLGFISYWDLEGFVYVEHFAISTTHRNQGLGTEIFKQLQEKVCYRPIVLEVEPPETSTARR